MKRRKILITGVCGMIGSHLVDALLERGEKDVTGIDDLSNGQRSNIAGALKDPSFKFRRADICDPAALRRLGGSDIIVHLAAFKKIGEAQPAMPTLRVNAFGTENVLRFAQGCGAKVVVGSTSDVYGRSTRLPFREDEDCVIGSSTAKRWAYAVSKLYAEQAALAFYKDEGVPVVVIRYFGGFSERSSKSWSGGHVPVFLDAIRRGRPVVIHGDGKQTRSMAHVSDLVRGTILAMDNPRAVGEIFNIGNDEELSVIQTARMVHKALGRPGKLKVKFVPMEKVFGSYREIARRVPDLSKAKRVLGYSPKVSFAQALERVVRAAR